MQILRKCKCGLIAYTEEELELFVLSKDSKYNRRNICRNCHSLNSSSGNMTDAQKEIVVARKRVYYLNNKERINKTNNEYYQNNKESVKATNDAWRRNNVDKIKLQNLHYNKVNYLKIAIKRRAARRNKPISSRAKRRNQTPSLTVKEQTAIRLLYRTARILSNITKTTRHVDHIIPIICGGLHHPSNLQILTASQNLTKSAKIPSNISSSNLEVHRCFYNDKTWTPTRST